MLRTSEIVRRAIEAIGGGQVQHLHGGAADVVHAADLQQVDVHLHRQCERLRRLRLLAALGPLVLDAQARRAQLVDLQLAVQQQHGLPVQLHLLCLHRQAVLRPGEPFDPQRAAQGSLHALGHQRDAALLQLGQRPAGRPFGAGPQPGRRPARGRPARPGPPGCRGTSAGTAWGAPSEGADQLQVQAELARLHPIGQVDLQRPERTAVAHACPDATRRTAGRPASRPPRRRRRRSRSRTASPRRSSAPAAATPRCRRTGSGPGRRRRWRARRRSRAGRSRAPWCRRRCGTAAWPAPARAMRPAPPRPRRATARGCRPAARSAACAARCAGTTRLAADQRDAAADLGTDGVARRGRRRRIEVAAVPDVVQAQRGAVAGVLRHGGGRPTPAPSRGRTAGRRCGRCARRRGCGRSAGAAHA